MKKYRYFVPGANHHVFIKAIDGNIIFYSIWDILCFFTLYCCLARKYGIVCNMLCIMPNHIHSNERCDSYEKFVAFHHDLEVLFVKFYNQQHCRRGPLFLRPFGYSPKMVGKKLKDNFCYIANNPVVGHLCDNFLQYRWNFLAYADSTNPYSEKIPLSQESFRMRNALKLLKYYRSNNLPLDYTRLENLTKTLSPDEVKRMIDYIISSYNCVSYESIASAFGGTVEMAFKSFKIVSGSEYDIPDDYDDYSIYVRMASLVKGKGVDLRTCNFETMDLKNLNRLFRLLPSAGAGDRQIRKFLHLARGV